MGDRSIVAIEAKTGKYRWHYQQVHHDIWDYDAASPVVLFDLDYGGVKRKAIAEGVYGSERAWLVENHGVDPDVVVDNPPHATFDGGDAQLDAALDYLRAAIARDPRPVPEPPPKDLRFDYPVRANPSGPEPVATPVARPR